MKIRTLAIRWLAAWLPGALLPPAFAATHVVTIANYYFNPTNLTVHPGDTVIWSNTVFTAHDTTQFTNYWVSPQLGQGQTFAFTFTNTGVYRYYCSLHIVAQPQQTGTVSVVTAPAPPAAVTLLNPAYADGAFRFSFATQTGYTYAAQFTAALAPTNWFSFTNLPGNGAVVQVADTGATNAQRFYRVSAR
jgi:plastocyanin